MTIGRGWITIIVVVIALAVLAPDSNVGGTIRDVFSQLRGATSSFMGTASTGLDETGEFFEE
ncbi:MAG: hypothetical protein ACR2RF_08145 [Geminicoccaceae bacterium]